MVNTELVELCRTVIGAIQETDNFDAKTLRVLLIHIVPKLLAELDILEKVLETVRLPDPVVIDPDPPADLPKKEKKKRKKRGRR